MRRPDALRHDTKDEFTQSDHVTPYDLAHLLVYARLLDAVATGMSDKAMIVEILELEPDTDGAEESLSRHLERARWIRETGYGQMLSDAHQLPLSGRR